MAKITMRYVLSDCGAAAEINTFMYEETINDDDDMSRTYFYNFVIIIL